MKEWVVNFGATRHICAKKDAFTSYSQVKNEEELIFLENSQAAKVLGKEKKSF